MSGDEIRPVRFVLAFYGTRGDVEPGVAIGRELQRRGHDVTLAVPPDLRGFAGAAGLKAVDYGPDVATWLESTRDFWYFFFRNFWRVGRIRAFLRDAREPGNRAWAEMSAMLTELTDGADVLVSGVSYQELAANVAEYRGVRLATVHWFPIRVNSHALSTLPAPVVRAGMTMYEGLVSRGVKKAEDTQRRTLGLPRATAAAPRRIAARGSMEIQAYDPVCFPGLAAEWARLNALTPPRRPFIGTLTLESPTDADADVAAWIAEGSPPIFFGFGSIPVDSAAATIAMISRACAQLGERALICAAASDFNHLTDAGQVKIVSAVNYATAFPACRAVVHHGGAGTTAAGLRAGVPTLILWMADFQFAWGAAVKRLKVGTARRFSATTEQTLVADLRTVLKPDCGYRARELAAQMASPAESVAAGADLLEDFARDPELRE